MCRAVLLKIGISHLHSRINFQPLDLAGLQNEGANRPRTGGKGRKSSCLSFSGARFMQVSQLPCSSSTT